MMVRLIVQTRLVTPEITEAIHGELTRLVTPEIIEAIHGVLTHSVTSEITVVTVAVQIRLETSDADKQLDFNPAIG